jgi:hypothetical protein
VNAWPGEGRAENHFGPEVAENLYEMKPPEPQLKPAGRGRPRYQIFIK